jgi:hypothetical protein
MRGNDGKSENPDVALMSFVKRFEREISSPCDFSLECAIVMIVQGWRRSLKTSVIKL